MTGEFTPAALYRLNQLAQEIDGAISAAPEIDEETGELVTPAPEFDIPSEMMKAALVNGVDACWRLAFNNPDFALHEAEKEPIAELLGMCIDKHFPNMLEKCGPELMLGGVVYIAWQSRISAGIAPRLEKKGEALDEAG